MKSELVQRIMKLFGRRSSSDDYQHVRQAVEASGRSQSGFLAQYIEETSCRREPSMFSPEERPSLFIEGTYRVIDNQHGREAGS